MPVEAVLALVVSGLSLGVAFVSFRRNVNKDNSAMVAAYATMTADIKYIRQSIDDIKLESRSMSKDFADLVERVVKIEAAVKSAHERIDNMKG